MKNSKKLHRNGFTLLELIVTTAMLATLTASCMVILRTSYSAWSRHQEDHAVRGNGLAVLKHIVRHTRQAKAVTDISLAADNSGHLSLLNTNGDVLVWEHDAATKQVLFGQTTASTVLATGVEELNFIGIKVDGSTPTTDPGLIHLVQCSTEVNITRPTGVQSVTTSNRAWLRAW